jgi:hypothetical protein
MNLVMDSSSLMCNDIRQNHLTNSSQYNLDKSQYDKESNFNQALKNDLLNRSNLQDSIKTHQSLFQNSISPPNKKKSKP